MKKILLVLLTMTLLSTILVGCKNEVPKEDETLNVSIKNIHEAVKKELGDNYFPDRDIEAAELEEFMNIDVENAEEFIAQSPMITMNVDTFIAIKAKDGMADDVEEDLIEYREFLNTDAFMYPMNLAKVAASEVVRHGDYVFFIMLGAYDEREEASDEERITFAKEEVNKVKEVINSFFK